LGQVALKVCLPWASQIALNDLLGRQLAYSLAHRASKSEKLLAQKEILLVLHDQKALFSSPANL